MKLAVLAIHSAPEFFISCPACNGVGATREAYDDGFDIRETIRPCEVCEMSMFVLSKEKYGKVANPL